MRLPVRRTSQADADLEEIWLYIATDNPSAAERVLQRLYRAEDRLGEFPEIGQARPEIAPTLRHWPVGSYLILYRIEPDCVRIVRVIHGARDLPAALGEP